MSRLPFRGKGAIQGLLAASLALPAISIIVPLQSVLLQLNLYGSKTGLVLAYAAMSVPFVIWIFQAHFNTIPRQLDQAAQIDGYGRMSTLYRVLLPGLRPAVMMGAIFVVLAAWNDYIIAAALVNSPSQRTIQVALAFYEGTNAREWGPLMAGVCLALAPPLLLFVIYRNVLMDGLARGALKE
jgi:ABC-type glycerol-3-phosphate transport system permease component